jgi:lipopolysaccharide/colanic/teichoic acid biosynthesis glycosyltransferase
MDLVLVVPILILVLPILLIAVAVVKVSAPQGPVLFRQERVGRNEGRFTLLKLRTMYVDAERIGTGTVTTRADPRIIRGGGVLRALKVDELPQLLNVLSGTMALVGPRPTVVSDYERMDARQRRRFRVRPGMTGLAQIRGNTALPWPERIEWDLRYVERQSVFLDLSIMAETAARILTGRIATDPPGENEWS